MATVKSNGKPNAKTSAMNTSAKKVAPTASKKK